MKVLFLDWDGVGNNHKTSVTTVDDMMVMADPFCTFLINRIVDRTECEVVLSSSWRHSKNWRKEMKAQGLVFNFLDRTPLEGSSIERGKQIKVWLDAHPEVTKYAIVDDYNDMLPEQQDNFFGTTWQDGMTEAIAEEIESYFKGRCRSKNDTIIVSK